MKWQRYSRGLVALAIIAYASGPVGAEDYLRGDVNSDGVVSLADSHALLAFLFRGAALSDCLDARDSNGDGAVNISDAVLVLNHLFDGGTAPAPEAELLGCEDRGAASLLIDREARLVILSAEADGGDDARATLVIGASHSLPVAGHSFDLHLPAALFAGTERSGTDLTGTMANGFDSGVLVGDTFRHGFLSSLVADAWIPASEDVVPIYELAVCLQAGTAAGDYPIEFTAGEFVADGSGIAVRPELVGGTLTVAADVTAGSECSRGPSPNPNPNPPAVPPDVGPINDAENVTWTITDDAAPPGASVALPFIIHSDGNVQGYALSVDFDEELLTATEIEIAWEIPGGEFDYGFSKFVFNNDNATPGNAGVDEGFLIGAAVFSLQSSVSMPANEDVEALLLHFDIAPDAPDTTTQVRFLDGAAPDGVPVHNVLTSNGHAVDIEFLESFVLVDCTLQIQAIVDITAFFLRGDSNDDGRVDVSDAQHTLNYLFVGSAPPGCFDAADSNDDGYLNVADPINTLQFLFLENGHDTLPMPYPEVGEDPTPDGITCSGFTRL